MKNFRKKLFEQKLTVNRLLDRGLCSPLLAARRLAFRVEDFSLPKLSNFQCSQSFRPAIAYSHPLSEKESNLQFLKEFVVKYSESVTGGLYSKV